MMCVHVCNCVFRGYPVGQVCKSCASGCTSCDATHCLSCEEALVLHKHECVASCPSGHTVRNGECVQCPESCVICSEDSCTGKTEIFHRCCMFLWTNPKIIVKNVCYWCTNSLLHFWVQIHLSPIVHILLITCK